MNYTTIGATFVICCPQRCPPSGYHGTWATTLTHPLPHWPGHPPPHPPTCSASSAKHFRPQPGRARRTGTGSPRPVAPRRPRVESANLSARPSAARRPCPAVSFHRPLRSWRLGGAILLGCGQKNRITALPWPRECFCRRPTSQSASARPPGLAEVVQSDKYTQRRLQEVGSRLPASGMVFEYNEFGSIMARRLELVRAFGLPMHHDKTARLAPSGLGQASRRHPPSMREPCPYTSTVLAVTAGVWNHGEQWLGGGVVCAPALRVSQIGHGRFA